MADTFRQLLTAFVIAELHERHGQPTPSGESSQDIALRIASLPAEDGVHLAYKLERVDDGVAASLTLQCKYAMAREWLQATGHPAIGDSVWALAALSDCERLASS
ncbi:hypothetical protein ACFO8O_10660 [Hephaestia sp. GCM10023244]|uniref:hypothetical protein n=1 Tax=unclassified Hephaestia TaxID=2631281 RepID=UPI00207701B8|nr:hypothetical protein [Hephaestia sp. MAHUQ-44]MCM8731420.1 hypothetical protein [Hephaestia sp. MAHUQ-44]